MGLRHYHHGRGCALCSVNRLGIHLHCWASRLGCFRDDGSVSWGSSTRAAVLAVWRSRHGIRATSWAKTTWGFPPSELMMVKSRPWHHEQRLRPYALLPYPHALGLDSVFTNISSSCEPSSVSVPRLQLSKCTSGRFTSEFAGKS